MLQSLAGILRGFPGSRGKPRPLGVDIGSSAVKLLRWPDNHDPEQPPDYAIEPLPPGAVASGAIRDVEAVGRRIAKALAAMPRRASEAVAAVPAAAVMQRKLEMDTSLPEAELEALVTLEAERHVSWPMAEASLDFRRLDAAGGPGRVLLTVCRRELVEARERALRLAGLRPIAVDVEHHAMERVLDRLAGKKEAGPVAIADIGAAAIRLHVFAGGRSVHCEASPFPGAGEASRDPAFARAAARQIAQAVQMFQSSSRHGHLNRVFLCGAAALADGLAEQARQALDPPVQIANPFPAEAGKPIALAAPALLLAAGLAIPGGIADE